MCLVGGAPLSFLFFSRGPDWQNGAWLSPFPRLPSKQRMDGRGKRWARLHDEPRPGGVAWPVLQ